VLGVTEDHLAPFAWDPVVANGVAPGTLFGKKLLPALAFHGIEAVKTRGFSFAAGQLKEFDVRGLLADAALFLGHLKERKF
jgi:hypothetical protein